MKGIFAGICLVLSGAALSYDKVGVDTTVSHIYADVYGGMFVYFGANSAPGCYNNNGITLPTGQNDGQAKILSMLLSAKATGQKVQAFYNINEGSTGWATCSLEAIYLKDN
jgi:hypothetical protein